MDAGEVGIVYRQRGIAVEVAGIGHRGGKINNPAGCVHRADTALSAEECACNALSCVPMVASDQRSSAEGVRGGDHQQCHRMQSDGHLFRPSACV